MAPTPPKSIDEKESSPAPHKSGIALPMVENKNTNSQEVVLLPIVLLAAVQCRARCRSGVADGADAVRGLIVLQRGAGHCAKVAGRRYVKEAQLC